MSISTALRFPDPAASTRGKPGDASVSIQSGFALKERRICKISKFFVLHGRHLWLERGRR
jgi:hypothetical protein